MWTDLGLALRRMRRTPGVTLAGALTLALGIGISAAVFSVVESTLLRQLPFQDPDSLVMVWNRQKAQVDRANLLSGPNVVDLRQRSRTLEGVAAMGEVIVAPVLGTETPTFARQAQVTANFFQVLGVKPLLGRMLEPGDGAPLPQNATTPPPRPVVISYDYWQRMLGGMRSVVGLRIRSFTTDNVIVGVLPQDFQVIFPAEAVVGEDLGAGIDLWTPFRSDLSQWNRESRGLRVVGRLASGASLSDVGGELEAIAAQLRAQHEPYEERGFALEAKAWTSQSTQHLRPLLALLAAAVGCVLLVSCVNVAGLLLARMTARRRELNVRSALGAGSGRLIRLALAESLALALLGGAAGVVLAVAAMRLLAWLRPGGLPQAADLSLNPAVLGFSLLLCMVSALLAGWVPALKAARESKRPSFNVREASASRNQRRTQDALAALQVALTLVLLIGAGLALRSFMRLQDVPLGFDASNVITADISTIAGGPDRSLPNPGRRWYRKRRNLEAQLHRNLNQVPGVEAAGAVFPVPLNGVYARTCSFRLPGGDDADTAGVAYFRNVWPGYFSSLGIPMQDGRDFDLRDDQPNAPEWPPPEGEERSDRPTVVIDRQLAERLWPGESPVGKRLTYNIYANVPHEAEVIGVVPFVPQSGLVDSMPTLYIPRSYYRSMELALTVKVTRDTPEQRRRLTRAIHGVLPDSPVLWRPLSGYVDKAQAPARFILTLLSVFAATAVLLASVGLYGALSLMVRQRTSEIGVRMALGARGGVILGLVLSRGLALAAVGILVGGIASLGVTRFLSAHLHGVSPTDPATFAATALLLIAVCALAGYLPARRASTLHPTEALRTD
ncbi:MAG TPA: ABC transporter permease [Acidobacteriota bacterium]|nr:ABC transporter permease [Acidobacteriota bacterium]